MDPELEETIKDIITYALSVNDEELISLIYDLVSKLYDDVPPWIYEALQ